MIIEAFEAAADICRHPKPLGLNDKYLATSSHLTCRGGRRLIRAQNHNGRHRTMMAADESPNSKRLESSSLDGAIRCLSRHVREITETAARAIGAAMGIKGPAIVQPLPRTIAGMRLPKYHGEKTNELVVFRVLQ